MSDNPADPPKQPRVFPRAARLSRLTPETPERPVEPDPTTDTAPAAPAPVAPTPVEPAPVEPAPVAPAPVEPAPVAAPVVAPPVGGAAPAGPITAAEPPRRTSAPLTTIGATSNDVVDLARSIANASPPPTELASTDSSSASGPVAGRALETGLPLRSVAATSYTPAPAQSMGPVTFKPLIDPWANRSVIVASFGLVLCFFPVLSLAGLLMGVFSLRRIGASGGSLIGARTARFGAMLGGAGFAIGVSFGVWILVTK